MAAVGADPLELPPVPGFRASGVATGVKASGPDLALLVADAPAAAAGVLTRSTVVGAPVALCRERLRRGRARAVVVNSGVSNVGLGERGLRDARRVTDAVARAIGCDAEEVLCASTGVIGEPLPVAKIRAGIPRAVEALRPGGLADAARAILTTDTRPKTAATTTRVDGAAVRVAGIAKGAGMVEPNLATMLAFLLTDAAVSPACLRRLLREASDATFNRLTVDGETSTSDTVLLLASGAAGHPRLASGAGAGGRRLLGALLEVCEHLVTELARDGEGASRLVRVRVSGGRNTREADRAARRIANSLLVKTAIFGGDPNWGRILQTLGAGRVSFDPVRLEIRLGGVAVYRRGAAAGPAARARAARALGSPEVDIEVDLGLGSGEARMWTCDLSYDYIRINAEYTT